MLKLFDIYLTIVLALIILIGMLAPISGVTNAPSGTDKIIHISAFAALVYPLALTRRIGPFSLFILASMFGGVIEIIQPSFGRDAEITDWVANNTGIICSIGITNFFSAIRIGFKKHW